MPLSSEKQHEISFRFKKDRLMIFTPKTILILNQWPDLTCVEKTLPDGYWVPKDLPFRILAPEEGRRDRGNVLTSLHRAKQCAYRDFRSAIPKEAAACLEPFRCRQLQPLRLLAAEPKRAAELFESTPNLAFIMANAHRLRSRLTHDQALSQAIHRIHHPQREIMKLMELPGTRQAVKLLRKIPPASMSDRVIRALPYLLQEKKRLDQLSHLTVITPPVMELLISKICSSRIRPVFLEEVAEGTFRPGEQSPADKIRHLVDLLEFLEEDTEFMLTSIDQLDQRIREAEEQSENRRQLLAELAAQQEAERQRLADQRTRDMVENMARREKQARTAIKEMIFPPPPVSGTENIQPLTSLKDLNHEGSECHNCVSERDVLRFKREHTYFYKVLSPERATLRIGKGTNENWVIGELRAPCNKDVQLKTLQAVLQWLDSFNQGLA